MEGMTIEELVKEKKNLRLKIINEIEYFRNKTGINPSGIDVNFIAEDTGAGSTKSYILDSVDITLNV